jgi:hypothetical protein
MAPRYVSRAGVRPGEANAVSTGPDTRSFVCGLDIEVNRPTVFNMFVDKEVC